MADFEVHIDLGGRTRPIGLARSNHVRGTETILFEYDRARLDDPDRFSLEPALNLMDLARIALVRLGLVGKGSERDRRPTQSELDKIISFYDGNARQLIPVGRIVRFAVATAMRQDEIARVQWCDFDPDARMLVIRDRKDPRKKKGNDQRIPLLDVSGYDACKITAEQDRTTNARTGRIFPYNSRSVGQDMAPIKTNLL